MSTTNVTIETGPESGIKRNVGTIHFENLPDMAPGLVNPILSGPDNSTDPGVPLPFRYEWLAAPDESSERLDELASHIGSALSQGQEAGRDHEYEWRVD